MDEEKTYLERIRDLKNNRDFNLDELNTIADEMEELLTPAEMWNTLRPGFSIDEFIENLEFIAKENDI